MTTNLHYDAGAEEWSTEALSRMIVAAMRLDYAVCRSALHGLARLAASLKADDALEAAAALAGRCKAQLEHALRVEAEDIWI